MARVSQIKSACCKANIYIKHTLLNKKNNLCKLNSTNFLWGPLLFNCSLDYDTTRHSRITHVMCNTTTPEFNINVHILVYTNMIIRFSAKLITLGKSWITRLYSAEKEEKNRKSRNSCNKTPHHTTAQIHIAVDCVHFCICKYVNTEN